MRAALSQRPGRRTAAWRGALPACIALLAGAWAGLAQPVAAQPAVTQPAVALGAADPIIGRWVSVSGNEALEVKPTGFLRNCFIGNKPGSASMGAWTRTAPGKYRVEFTHAITRGCDDTPRTLRRYEMSILGHATANRDELALYVSGEFPPDRFVRKPAQ